MVYNIKPRRDWQALDATMKLLQISHLMYLLMLSASCVISSCSDDELSITGKVEIPEEADLMKLERWSYEVPLEVKSDSEWKVETTGNICYVFPEEG